MLINALYLILIGLMMLLPCQFILHMFQQNRYELDRYSSWFKANTKVIVKENVTTLCAMVLVIIARFFDGYEVITIWIITFKIIVDYALFRRKKSIKPLKYTHRVKRQVALVLVLNVIWLMLALIYIPKEYVFIVIIIALWINQGLIVLSIMMLKPLEAYFHKSFMKQAKAILASNPNLTIIGITGSYGKTSSKNILQEILSAKYYSLMTPESFNTPMGITLTIKNQLKALHQTFICEMGADHVGDIEELMNFVKPRIGIVTSIGPQHLTTFLSQENIINEKMKAIEMLSENGVGILNVDNDFIRHYEVKNKQVKLIKVGIDESDVDYQAINIQYTNKGSSFDIKSKAGLHHYETSLLGKHNIMNILVAVAVGEYLGIESKELIRAVKRCPFIKHRLELKTINGLHFIDNAFNSNPSGANMSLEVLSMMPGKRFIVTPGMIDLGDKQDAYNYDFGYNMKGKADYCILVGENQTKKIYQGLLESGFNMECVKVVAKVKEAFDEVYLLASKVDTILLENDLPDAFNN